MMHAHWNLDQGASAADLLSACRKALLVTAAATLADERHSNRRSTGAPSSRIASTNIEKEVDDALASIQRLVVSEVAAAGNDAGWASVLEFFLTRLRWIPPKHTTQASPFPLRITVFLEDAIRIVKIRRVMDAASAPSTSLSSSTPDSEALFCLPREGAASVLLDLASILFCMDALHVDSVSYSPIPLRPDATPQHIQQLVGLSVAPVSAAFPSRRYDDATILFLQLLTQGSLWMSLADPGPSQLKLVCQELSVRDGTVDEMHNVEGSSEVRVTLTIGTVTPADPLEVAHHARGEGRPSNTTTRAAAKVAVPPPSPLPWNVDRLVLLETNVDDVTPEHCAYVMELVLSGGCALDAWTTSIGMKKGRTSAQKLSVLCHERQKGDATMLLFRHSGTLGIRQQFVDRASLHRRTVTVHVEREDREGILHDGLVDVKVGYMLKIQPTADVAHEEEEERVSMKAEFDHCRALSLATGAPIRSISDEAVRLAREHIQSIP
jgi:Protein of unknown function DUF111